MKISGDEIYPDDLPYVDYSERALPPEIVEIIEKSIFKIEKKVKLTWANKQFLIRIPSEISKEMRITEENYVVFTMQKPFSGSDAQPTLDIKLF